ncbi:Rne/Rng family ribonuclease [Phycicoccus sp. BSK3Z-2]|uniref:Ribonuclease E n=1 Tax=Phycicoccus avicenniae TaxID=2828860 RepID=A0A941I2B9_9MICO|nr:Rne/Rng family ribonuclease [Phycicoccus avicenniae]MBR7744874.1 Rne/Rng family ribonuclease [Phycicoccus avicenniae]
MASENEPTTPATVEPATTDTAGATDAPAEQPTAAPARKATRKRATKKASAPAAEPAAPAGPDDGPADAAATDAPAEQPKAAPAKKATRKRASKKAASPADEAPTAASTDAALAEPAAAPGPDAATGAAEAPAAGGPGLGLLFQAPDPEAAKPRRRASAPAQSPSEAPRQDRSEDEAPNAAESSEPARDAADDGDDADEGGSRRRRRGGRGRRGRSRSGEDQTGDEQGSDSDESASSDDSSDDDGEGSGSGGRRRGRRSGRSKAGSGDAGNDREKDSGDGPGEGDSDDSDDDGSGSSSSRRRRRRRRGASGGDSDDPPGTVTKVRQPRADRDEPTAVKGSTRLEAKKQRRREGREAGRRRTIITEAEFLARRESVERTMVVRGREGRTQIGVLEDDVLVEHYVSRETTASMAGNVYLGRVQNVLPSMEAAFVDIGKGRNAVLYAGEVNWDAAGLEANQPKRIENALKSGDTVLVQVTKDPIGHKGARLTSQISLPGRYLVYVPEGSMTGISRKLPDTERSRLKGILKQVVPDSAGVIVRTAAEGASEEELTADVERLTKQWERIKGKADKATAKKSGGGGAPQLLHGEPDLTIRVIRDVFTEDFTKLVVSGDKAWSEVSEYVEDVAPDLAQRLTRWTDEQDVFAAHRIDEQIAKAMDRKVWLPSGGSLVIDRTEAMTVVDVNTGKFVGSGGNLEETVTKNNLEAAEEIVRQLRLRDIGGIIVIDFIDMVLESNRDLVVRRLLECLGRDRTKHQVAEVTSLGLVQMTRKRVGSGLIEVFSEACEHCSGRGIVVHAEPVEKTNGGGDSGGGRGRGRRGGSGGSGNGGSNGPSGSGGKGSGSNGSSGGGSGQAEEHPERSGPTAAQIAAAAHAAAIKHTEHGDVVVDPDAVGAAAVEAADTAPKDPPVEAAPSPDPGATTAPAEATPPTDVPEPVAEQPVVPPALPVSEPEPEQPRRRRKRGRVVAPAGPPQGGEAGDAPAAEADAPAEPDSDGS